MSFKPTEEQDAIIAAVAEPSSDSIMVEAGAGCAKSKTLELSAPGVRCPAIALAFNKAIAQELKPRLPGSFEVKTFNGLGHGAWMRANPSVNRWELDERKLGKLITQIAKDRKVSLAGDQWDQVRQLTTAAMNAGLALNDEGNGLVADIPENWLSLCDALWIDLADQAFIIDFAHFVLEEDVALARKGTISFDDQVYCSAVLGGKFPRYPVVMGDEAQDLSPLNHHMLRQSVSEHGRFIMVGDRRQAIYAFRGADSESMNNLRALRPQWKDRQLTMTFRCPSAIVERQQQHFPGFRAAPGNARGAFVTAEAPGAAEEWSGWNIDWIKAKHPAAASIAVLCRNNAPLMSLAFKLIRGGIGCQVLGRDIGKGLQALLKKIIPEDDTPADICGGKISEWAESQISLARANGKEEKIAAITDKSESLLACLEGSGARSAGELRQVIGQLFERSGGQIVLATGHKAKGLEWDLVVHLDPWRIPSKFARKAAAQGDMSQLKQEYNLRYVIETRTRHTLVNANLEDFNG